jgi:hypothetical protein
MVRVLILCINLMTAPVGYIVYTKLLDMDMIVLNSEEVTNGLLEGRSRIYSDRPYMATIDLCLIFVFNKYINQLTICYLYSFGREWTTSPARYEAMHTTHRRLYHEVFLSEAALTYRPKQLQKAYEMLLSILHYHENYAGHFEASVLMCLLDNRSQRMFILNIHSIPVIPDTLT